METRCTGASSFSADSVIPDRPLQNAATEAFRKDGVGILISTYNGSERLPDTLKALSELDRSGIPEVTLTIVDNASTDGTSDRARSIWDSLGSPFQLSVLYEGTPGKLHAQETGLASMRHEFVVICDDDNSLSSDYLRIGLAVLREHPEVGVLGGRGMAVSTVPIPSWFEQYSYYYACAPQAPGTGDVRPTRNVVYGAGMWLRMEGYHRAKGAGFRFMLGSRTGKALTTGGEDSELCWALRFQGYAVWYVDEMRFAHHIPRERLTEEYRERLLRGMGSNGPLGNIYLRVAKGEFPAPVRLFWLKELAYTLLDLLKLPFTGRCTVPEIRRMGTNIRYFISERGNYDRAVNQVLAFHRQFT